MSILPDRSAKESYLVDHRVFPLVAHNTAHLRSEILKGTCPVCGNEAEFRGFTENERESGTCSQCGCMNRHRQMALVIRALHDYPIFGAEMLPADLTIYNSESSGPVHDILKALPGYTSSEYFGPDIPRGSLVNGVKHEDLRSLTFANASLDLVLSSDVFEHFPHPYDAHREIYRVLKPNGRHIFTVPFYPWEALDEVRAIEKNGTVEYLAEKIFHEDPVRPEEGVLVWTIFGLQMIVELAKIGFTVSYWNLLAPEHGIIGPWSIVFSAQKI